jgi:glucose 1-dehydrogenase
MSSRPQALPTDPSSLDAARTHAIPNRLAGRVAVISGASSGIGQAIAIRLAAEGASVVIDYIGDPAGADKTRTTIEQAGGRAITVQADISHVAESAKLVDEAYTQLGRCDILVNNAGIEKGADFWQVAEADYDAVLNVNLKGAFFLTQAFVKRLIDAKQPGRVINISSVHEDMVFPHFASYAASKGGMRMLMRNLAVELGPHNITVNNVAPGAIVTPINAKLLDNKPQLDALLANIPLGRMGTSAEVAGLVAFLSSGEAAYITGSTYVIDGGLMRNYKEQ